MFVQWLCGNDVCGNRQGCSRSRDLVEGESRRTPSARSYLDGNGSTNWLVVGDSWSNNQAIRTLIRERPGSACKLAMRRMIR